MVATVTTERGLSRLPAALGNRTRGVCLALVKRDRPPRKTSPWQINTSQCVSSLERLDLHPAGCPHGVESDQCGPRWVPQDGVWTDSESLMPSLESLPMPALRERGSLASRLPLWDPTSGAGATLTG